MSKKKPRTKEQALEDLGQLLRDIFPYLHIDYRDALVRAMNALEIEKDIERSEGLVLIAIERRRQIAEEGWTEEHDNQFAESELAMAAACYILDLIEPDGDHYKLWPWESEGFKPTHNDPIRQLTKAGALIAAEIDRLHRFNELVKKAEKEPKDSFLNP